MLHGLARGLRSPGKAAGGARGLQPAARAVTAPARRGTAQLAAAARSATAQPTAATGLALAQSAAAAATTVAPVMVLATAPLLAQHAASAAAQQPPWGAAAFVRQHMILQQAMGRALVGPAMMQRAPAALCMGEAEASQQFAATMAEAAQTMQHAHVEDTVRARQHVAADAQQCFSQLPMAWGVSLATAGPEHIVYWAQQYSKQHTGERSPWDAGEQWWPPPLGMAAARSSWHATGYPAHSVPPPLPAGTVLPDGSDVAAPSSVQGALSHLSAALGRQGSWDTDTRSGNPVDSQPVQLFKQGYERQLRGRG